ncbi:MAG: hypothetical protein ACE5H1_02375 [Thermodesulfobacteriota bacterium]
MTNKFIGFAVFVLFIFIFQVHVNAQNISPKESKELKAFLKEKMGNFVPPEAKIDVKGFQTTPLKGFKKGTYVINTSKGSGEVPFLISEDGKYLVLGEPVDTKTFQDGPLGVKHGKVQIGAGMPIPVLMSKDGRYLVIGGELIEYKQNSSN